MRLALDPAQVVKGRALWGLLTHGLIHANLWHLLLNLYALYVSETTSRTSWKMSFRAHPRELGDRGRAAQTFAAPAVMVGISGGVSGLMGAYVALFRA